MPLEAFASFANPTTNPTNDELGKILQQPISGPSNKQRYIAIWNKLKNRFPDVVKPKDAKDTTTMLPHSSEADLFDSLAVLLDEKQYHIKVKPHYIYAVLGLVAGLITFVAIMVQIVDIFVHKNACNFVWAFVIGTLLTQTLWFIFGVGMGIWVQMIVSGVGILVGILLLVLKITYGTGDKCNGVKDPSA